MYLFFVVIFLINCGQVFNYGTIVSPVTVDTTHDAKIILNSQDRTISLINIFSQRIFYERQQINNTYTQLNSGVPLVSGNWVPLKGNQFQDLLYATIAGPQKTFAAYLHSCLSTIHDRSYAPIAIEILVISDSDKQALINAYDQNPFNDGSLENAVAQFPQNDYHYFLQELIMRTREDESTPINPNDVNSAIKSLLIECNNWNSGRILIDYYLMNKSKKFAQQVIQQFAAANNGKTMVQTVYDNISDQTLKFGYASLIYYILDPVDWMAARIHDSENEIDQKATKILFIVPYSECCLYEINTKFQQKYHMTIGQYLRSNDPYDPVDQMLAAIADDGIADHI